MRGGRPGAWARAQGLGAGGAERAEPGGRGRAAGGRGRGRAPPAASPCPSPRGGCIAERQGSAPPWCSLDSCTNPENRIKRKGKAWQRRLPLPSTLMLNPHFLWGGLFQKGLWPRVGREKPLLCAPSGERLRSFALDTDCWEKPRQDIGWVGGRLGGLFGLDHPQRSAQCSILIPGIFPSRRPSRSLQRVALIRPGRQPLARPEYLTAPEMPFGSLQLG